MKKVGGMYYVVISARWVVFAQFAVCVCGHCSVERGGWARRGGGARARAVDVVCGGMLALFAVPVVMLPAKVRAREESRRNPADQWTTTPRAEH